MRKHHGDSALIAELNTSACRGKERHPSKAHAKAVGRRILQQGRAPARGFVLNAYKCAICGYWHTGNSHRRHHVDPASVVYHRRREDDASPLEVALAEALRPYLEIPA